MDNRIKSVLSKASKAMALPAVVMTMALTGCGSADGVEVQIKNPADIDRQAETVDVPLSTVRDRLGYEEFCVCDPQGNKVAYQLTSDSLVVFQCDVKAGGEVVYKIQKGQTLEVSNEVCGKIYTNRQDDLSWENQVVGFRAYGPGSQARNERLYGYDLWLKRNTTAPVIEEMVARNQNGETWAMINEVRKTDPQKADSLANEATYHRDHGVGMDCYAVGQTLGAATAALMVNDSIVYPWCYKDAKVLDNGPIRFKAELSFPPFALNGDTITEVRVITLDGSSNLNRTEVRFDGLKNQTTQPNVVTGIVLHDQDGAIKLDNRYMSYVDPTQGSDNGQLYIGAVFPQPTDSTIESRELGHILGINQYDSNQTYVYYWGFGWDRGNMPSFDAWNEYLQNTVTKLDQPLEVKVK